MISTNQDHSRRLYSLASSRTRDVHGGLAAQTHHVALLDVSEQLYRAGSLRVHIQSPPHARLQELRLAAITIAGIELLRLIHTGQLALGRLRLKNQPTSAVWKAVLGE